MNVKEGARRMKKIGRACIMLGSSVGLLALVTELLIRFTDLAFTIRGFFFWPLILLSFYPILGGAVLWIAGYIVEGFAQPTSTPPTGS